MVSNPQLPLAIRGVNLPKRPLRSVRKRSERVFSESTVNDTDSRNEPVIDSQIVRARTYCFGADWIEFTATLGPEGLPEHPFLYTHTHSGHGSKYYIDMYKVDTVLHGEVLPFCELHVKPRPSFLDTNLVQVKIDNRFCYTPDIKTAIESFCREYNLTFKNITRLDLFADMQEVSGYERNVDRFLSDCGSRNLVLKGRSMKVHWKRNEVTGITWGSRSSGLSMTWYNKTAEMLKKTWKPWIEQLWQNAGFDMDYDVYRLEFSMKKPKVDIVTADGETLCLNHDIDMLTKQKELFDFTYQHYFQLAVNKEGERFSRLTRYYPIFLDATPYSTDTCCIKPKSTNYTKAYIKRLALDAVFYQKKGNFSESSFAFDHLLEVVDRYSLGKWFEQKFGWLDLRRSRISMLDLLRNKYEAFDKLSKQHYVQTTLPLNRVLC